MSFAELLLSRTEESWRYFLICITIFQRARAATNAISHIDNIRWIPLTPEICLTASMLIKEYGVNPVDAYHAATALSQDKTILSTEHVYDRIKGITRIDPETYARQL